MAKFHQEREDLLREGTAMIMRGRIRWTFEQAGTGEIVLGWRRDGSFSCFCDQDPVFHFNPQHQLRRVYFEGVRFGCENGGLFELRQVRGTSRRLQLQHVPTSETVRDQILDRWDRVSQDLQNNVRVWPGQNSETAMPLGQLETVGGDDSTLIDRMAEWLSHLRSPPTLAGKL